MARASPSERSSERWSPGPADPRLSEGSLQVWRADLTAVSDDLLALLTGEERGRAARILDARKARLWARARAVLRTLLGVYLKRDPATLRIAPDGHGKPALLGQPASCARAARCVATSGLRFNLSHSRELALYAFSASGPVGVDVELARRPINEIALASRAFGTREAHRLQELEPPVRQRELLRAWVRREAALKCLGTGLGAPHPAAGDQAPWVTELEVGAGATAAVAAAAAPSELRCWRWPAG